MGIYTAQAILGAEGDETGLDLISILVFKPIHFTLIFT